MTYLLHDEDATRAFAARLARCLRPGDVVALRGDLGAGKTALAREVIRSLGYDGGEIPSPTFTLVQTYEVSAGTIWHFDLYRLGDATEVFELGWDEARIEGIILVEWPERLGRLLPETCLEIILVQGGPGTGGPAPGNIEDTRQVTVTGGGDWPQRLVAL